MPDSPPGFNRYCIDADDRIESVDMNWTTFARENGAPELQGDAVLGYSLWAFVQGDEIEELYRAVFERVRSLDVSIMLPFRCDSPDLRRYMRLVVQRRRGASLQVDAVTIREQPQLHVNLLEPTGVRSDLSLSICGHCKRVLVSGEEWIEPEDAALRLQLLESEGVPRLDHRVCPDCVRIFESSGSGIGAH